MNFPSGFIPPARGPRPGARRPQKPGRFSWLRRPRLPRLRVGGVWQGLRTALAAHTRRAIGFAVLAIACVLLVAMNSLPVALAPVAPRLALAVSPGHPSSLLQIARDDRREMTALLHPPPADAKAAAPAGRSGAASGSSATQAGGDADADAGPDAETPEDPDAAEPATTPGADLQHLRADIRDRARAVLRSAPLTAEAYRLLGEAEETPDEVRTAMLNAFALSRREPVATFTLLIEAYERRAFADALEKADALLRNTPALNSYTSSYLTPMLSDPDARAALVDVLKQKPPWRTAFLQSLGDKVSSDDGVELFLAMKQAGSPASSAELTPYLLARLQNAKDPQGSYNVWLQLLSDEELARLLPVNNADFAADPSGTPFDWRITRGRNVTVRIVRLKDEPEARAIRTDFGVGRVRFGGVSQVVFLRPGSYMFEGQQFGTMSAKRGMVWEVRCFPKSNLLGQSSQLFGSRRGWQGFEFPFTVPPTGCQTQIIRLLHDSRSASEEYASGDIQFSKIRVNPAAADGANGESYLPAGR
ncbi:MAG: hypothetical protein B7Y70_07515 [Rhizobiales bacterium 35-68-8]|nr:MAG: hypothetical protein B7Y70_07515 [Rhizobiales bacterium 35-68-8]